MAEKCANTSGPPPSGSMNPNPLALLNHLTAPIGMSASLILVGRVLVARTANFLQAFTNVSRRFDPEMTARGRAMNTHPRQNRAAGLSLFHTLRRAQPPQHGSLDTAR